MTRRVRFGVVGSLAVLAAVVGTCALRDGRAETPTRLQPLERLVRGAWHDEENGTRTVFEWGMDRQVLHERVTEASSGAAVREVLYFWHPRKDSLALHAVLAGGEVREGILRPTEEGFEVRFNAYHPDGGGASYREVLRFLGSDRLVRSVHRMTEEEEILDEEVSLVRKRR